MPQQSGIYMIVNSVTGACYVGSAVNLPKRKREHFSALKRGDHHSAYLQRSYQLHGESAFEWSVLEETEPDRDLLLERETYWVQALQPQYNSHTVSATRLGAKLTPEQVARIKDARNRPEVREKLESSLKGHEVLPETREKIRQSLKGRPASEETKALLLHYSMQRTPEQRRNTMLGKAHSEETKRQMSEAAKARRKPTEEERQKLSEAAKNRVYTDEGRRKRSESMKLRWQQRKEAQQPKLFD